MASASKTIYDGITANKRFFGSSGISEFLSGSRKTVYFAIGPIRANQAARRRIGNSAVSQEFASGSAYGSRRTASTCSRYGMERCRGVQRCGSRAQRRHRWTTTHWRNEHLQIATEGSHQGDGNEIPETASADRVLQRHRYPPHAPA